MFSTLPLVIFDGLRIIAALACIVLVAATPYAMRLRGMRWHQRVRFLGLALISVAVIGAYLETLGTVPPAAWRLVFIVAGTVLASVGTLAFLRDTARPPKRLYRPGRHTR